jgi:hypothetical protein
MQVGSIDTRQSMFAAIDVLFLNAWWEP